MWATLRWLSQKLKQTEPKLMSLPLNHLSYLMPQNFKSTKMRPRVAESSFYWILRSSWLHSFGIIWLIAIPTFLLLNVVPSPFSYSLRWISEKIENNSFQELWRLWRMCESQKAVWQLCTCMWWIRIITYLDLSRHVQSFLTNELVTEPKEKPTVAKAESCLLCYLQSIKYYISAKKNTKWSTNLRRYSKIKSTLIM